MKKLLFLIAGISTIAAAEDVRDSDRIVCATQEVILCVEHGDCFNTIFIQNSPPIFWPNANSGDIFYSNWNRINSFDDCLFNVF